MWLNEYEIEEMAQRYYQSGSPEMRAATATLENLMHWTNRNSDGWPYWRKPAQAARKLCEMVYHHDMRLRFGRGEHAYATPETLKAALKPIKAFRTRQGADFEVVE